MSIVVERGTALKSAVTHSPDRVSLREFLALIVSLAFVAALIQHFGLESDAFLRLAILSFAGFAVHYFLPFRLRFPFFLLLSVSTIGLLLGVVPTLWIAGLGLALIGLCHLPVPFGIRVALLVLAGSLLAMLRVDVITAPWPSAIWPILGSMFMFRLVIYVYDLRHESTRPSVWSSLSYFFLLPNVCFPLFPVVDFKTFRRTYYNDERHRIYHVGVQWIFRGVVQLILYRIVYQNLVTDPASVVNAVDLARYLIWPFLLYLRVSGQFHVIVGLLHLFGFNLPETHHSYYLTSSFTDFWRRINIYWKDFMMKVFYYPAYFALRKRGETTALVISTIAVFAATWVFHSYQWLWFRGDVLLAWNDVLFWTVLALFVVLNSVYEFRRGRQRVLAGRSLPWNQTLTTALRTVGMYVFISILWSLWSTDSLRTWTSLWIAAGRWPSDPSPWQLAFIVAVPLTVGLAAVGASRAWWPGWPSSIERSAALIVVSAAVLAVGSSSMVYKRLGATGELIAAARFGGLNRTDMVGLERGYYENLMGIDKFNGELWALYTNRPPDWAKGVIEAGVGRRVDDKLPWELLPSSERRFKGVMLRTNQWGMHDKEYSKLPPPGCYRIALLGASHAMGTGVEREQTFEAQLEQRLNRDQEPGGRRCYEILNFAVYGYNPIQQIDLLDERVAEFRPNAILYVAHPEDSVRVERFVTQKVQTGAALPFEYLTNLVKEAGVDSSMPERVISQRLSGSGGKILAWVYQRLVADTARHDMCAGLLFLPMIAEVKSAVDVNRELELAREAGFSVFDMSGVYDVPDRNSLWIAAWDAHPNAKAHALIADRLYGQVRERKAFLSCGQPEN